MRTNSVRRILAASLGLACLASGARADAGNETRRDWLVGPYIAPSAPIDVLDGVVSFKPSPSATPGEFNDALGLFSDRGAAVRALDRHRRGGRIFAGFVYSQRDGQMMVQCGQTSSWKLDWDEIIDHRGKGLKDWNSVIEFGSFNNFKYASRQDRVFAIAKCLSEIPGMPPLKPIHPNPTEMRIEPAAFADAVRWLSSEDAPAIRGTDEQYRAVFNCLATHAARSLEGVGHIVAVRRIRVHHPARTETHHYLFGTETKEYAEVDYHAYVMGVLSSDTARERFFDRGINDITGIWPTRAGFEGLNADGVDNPIIQMLGANVVRDHMEGCRRRAGLFVVPPARVEVGPRAPDCR